MEPPSDNFLYTKGQTAEFMALADAFAIVDNKEFLLHSHILSKSSLVFAQLFSSFRGPADAPAGRRDVSKLFEGARWQSVNNFLYAIYNDRDEGVSQVAEEAGRSFAEVLE